ncbi:hypothetical protein G9A89_000288 [Geosiphon pyriformis]|nr:hypothetical protein G9A89_000288 [Geosiphon pyriformis]
MISHRNRLPQPKKKRHTILDGSLIALSESEEDIPPPPMDKTPTTSSSLVQYSTPTKQGTKMFSSPEAQLMKKDELYPTSECETDNKKLSSLSVPSHLQNHHHISQQKVKVFLILLYRSS